MSFKVSEVQDLLEGCLGGIPLELLEEARHQITRRPTHRLSQLMDLGDDLALQT